MGRTEAAYRERIRSKYNAITDIWGGADRWHAWTRHQIERSMRLTLRNYLPQIGADPLVIDVGSGGDSYGIDVTKRIDIDIAEHLLRTNGWSVCANGEALPIKSDLADLVVCVGPVINYCSFEETLSEMARVLRSQRFIVLHVELSNSWEFLVPLITVPMLHSSKPSIKERNHCGFMERAMSVA